MSLMLKLWQFYNKEMFIIVLTEKQIIKCFILLVLDFNIESIFTYKLFNKFVQRTDFGNNIVV